MTLVLLFIWITLVYIACVLPGPLRRRLEKERNVLAWTGQMDAGGSLGSFTDDRNQGGEAKMTVEMREVVKAAKELAIARILMDAWRLSQRSDEIGQALYSLAISRNQKTQEAYDAAIARASLDDIKEAEVIISQRKVI